MSDSLPCCHDLVVVFSDYRGTIHDIVFSVTCSSLRSAAAVCCVLTKRGTLNDSVLLFHLPSIMLSCLSLV